MRSRPRLRTAAPLAAAAVILTGGLGSLATPAFAGSSAFTPGDLVIYEVQGTSTAASAVDLVDYSTSGVPSGYSVTLPSADSGTTHSLVESGSALNDGELTDSADGQSLVATGYDDAVGTPSITSTTPAPPGRWTSSPRPARWMPPPPSPPPRWRPTTSGRPPPR